MKTIKFLTLIVLFVGLGSCTKSSSEPGNDVVTFTGSFSREFDVQGTTQRASYTISEDKINYDLSGGFVQSNYDISIQYYSKAANRLIAYRGSNNAYYVIFFKDIKENEITLYKKTVSSIEEGKSEPVPADDNTDNHGWNTYKKDLPISGKIKNLHAPQGGGQGQPVSGEFTKFDFATGATTVSATEWDIAFRGTTIIVNGGVASGTTDEPERNGNAAAYIATGTFESIKVVDESKLVQDAAAGLAITTGSGNGWYNYTGSPLHQIVPIAGKILVFKTRDGKYAKVEILSYYKDLDTNSDSKYFSFNYEFQANDGVTSF